MRPKRLINLLVAVCMMITMLPLSAVTAFAADTSTEQEASYKGYKYAYTVNGGNATITKFLGPDDSANPVDSASTVSYDIEIPEKLGIYTVTGLGKDSFTGYPFAGDWYKFGRNIRSVTIPQSVTSIGDHAFYYCTALTEITIPQSVTFMGDRAFTGCAKLNSLTIDDAAISIGDWAFAECYVLSKLSLGKKLRRSAIMPFLIAVFWITSPFHKASLPSDQQPLLVAMSLQRFRWVRILRRSAIVPLKIAGI